MNKSYQKSRQAMLLSRTLFCGLIFSLPFNAAQAEVHPGETLHNDANCMKCHAENLTAPKKHLHGLNW